MTSRLFRGVLFFALVLLATGSNAMQEESESTLARIQERGVLILGTSGNMPTMSQADENGNVVGFDIDIARLMADSMGVKLDVRMMPFGQLLTALETDEVDVVISNMTITSKRNLRVAFVGPYLTSGKCIITKDAALAAAKSAFNTKLCPRFSL